MSQRALFEGAAFVQVDGMKNTPLTGDAVNFTIPDREKRSQSTVMMK